MSFALKSNLYHPQPGASGNGVFGAYGSEPLACVAPKWIWSELANACICAPGYAPSPDGRDCLPLPDGAGAPEPVPPTTTPPATTGLSAIPTWAILAGGLVVIVVAVKVL